MDIHSLKNELRTFVESVGHVESENYELRAKVAELEKENHAWAESFDIAKASWRQQGVQHGHNVRSQTAAEHRAQFQEFSAQVVTRVVDEKKHTDEALLSSLLVRSRFDLAISEHQKRILGAAGSKGASTGMLTVQDFDIEDNHVGIMNNSPKMINMGGYVLMFRESGAVFQFPAMDVAPRTSLSVWFGTSHSAMRESMADGSLQWIPRSNNQIVVDDIDEVVDLVDAHGTMISSVGTNKARQGTSDCLSLFRVNGNKRPAEDEDVSDSQMVLSAYKPKRGRSEQCSQHILPVTPGSLVARFGKDTYAGDSSHMRTDSHENDENVHEDRTRPTSASSTDVSVSSSMHTSILSRTPMMGGNRHLPDTAALRPTLFQRKQGAISIRHAHRSGDDGFVAIRLCCNIPLESSTTQVDMSGWRLIVLGHPCHELVLSDRTAISASGCITLVSGNDPRTTAWLDAVHDNWRHEDGPINDDDLLALTPRSSSSSSSSAEEATGGDREKRIHVAGLGAIAKGDVVAVYLVDTAGHSVCMTCSVDDRTENTSRRTVFGDLYPVPKKVVKKLSSSCVLQ